MALVPPAGGSANDRNAPFLRDGASRLTVGHFYRIRANTARSNPVSALTAARQARCSRCCAIYGLGLTGDRFPLMIPGDAAAHKRRRFETPLTAHESKAVSKAGTSFCPWCCSCDTCSACIVPPGNELLRAAYDEVDAQLRGRLLGDKGPVQGAVDDDLCYLAAAAMVARGPCRDPVVFGADVVDRATKGALSPEAAVGWLRNRFPGADGPGVMAPTNLASGAATTSLSTTLASGGDGAAAGASGGRRADIGRDTPSPPHPGLSVDTDPFAADAAAAAGMSPSGQSFATDNYPDSDYGIGDLFAPSLPAAVTTDGVAPAPASPLAAVRTAPLIDFDCKQGDYRYYLQVGSSWRSCARGFIEVFAAASAAGGSLLILTQVCGNITVDACIAPDTQSPSQQQLADRDILDVLTRGDYIVEDVSDRGAPLDVPSSSRATALQRPSTTCVALPCFAEAQRPGGFPCPQQ